MIDLLNKIILRNVTGEVIKLLNSRALTESSYYYPYDAIQIYLKMNSTK